MKNETPTERTCPKCGCVYTEVPALSRTDNKTLICPDCGIREALESMGISKEEQEKIIGVMFVTFIIAIIVDYQPKMR